MGGKFGEVSDAGDGNLDQNANAQQWEATVQQMQDRTSTARTGDVNLVAYNDIQPPGQQLFDSLQVRYGGLPEPGSQVGSNIGTKAEVRDAALFYQERATGDAATKWASFNKLLAV